MATRQKTVSEMVIMGRIVAPYGIHGWLKVLPDTEMLDSLFDYPSWWLGRDGNWREYSVETARTHTDTLVVKLEGIDDRDAALACKSQQVAVPREQLPGTGENEYYWSDLIGLEVVNQQQVNFGKVIDVFATGANDVLVVKSERERLLPFIADVVLNVDTAARKILVEWDPEF